MSNKINPYLSHKIHLNKIQATPRIISFPKAPRFPKDDQVNVSTDFVVTDTKSVRATSFGYGQKKMSPLFVNTIDRDTPGPSDYFKNTKLKKVTGPTMLGKDQRKFLLPGIPEVSSNDPTPGPGKYNVLQNFGKQGLKYTIGQRGKLYYDYLEQNYTPSSNDYFPNQDAIYAKRYKRVGMGLGQKWEINRSYDDDIPGPGTYNIPSKFSQLKKKINLLQTSALATLNEQIIDIQR